MGRSLLRWPPSAPPNLKACLHLAVAPARHDEVMGYFMSYDTENSTGREVQLQADSRDASWAESLMLADRLRAVRARTFRDNDQEPPTTELLAVFSREDGWVKLRQDYRPGWNSLSPEAKAALRENPGAVPGRFVPELARAKMFVTSTAWQGDEFSEWSPSVDVQAFVRALPPERKG